MPSVHMLDHFCSLLERLRSFEMTKVSAKGSQKYDSYVNSSIDERVSSEDEDDSSEEE